MQVTKYSIALYFLTAYNRAYGDTLALALEGTELYLPTHIEQALPTYCQQREQNCGSENLDQDLTSEHAL